MARNSHGKETRRAFEGSFVTLLQSHQSFLRSSDMPDGLAAALKALADEWSARVRSSKREEEALALVRDARKSMFDFAIERAKDMEAAGNALKDEKVPLASRIEAFHKSMADIANRRQKHLLEITDFYSLQPAAPEHKRARTAEDA
jgi:hypothetical protein